VSASRLHAAFRARSRAEHLGRRAWGLPGELGDLAPLLPLVEQRSLAPPQSKIAVARHAWLQQSFVEKGEKLVRRQELPEEAVLSVAEALAALAALEAVDRLYAAGVISHAWLAPGHPDPDSKRRECIGKVLCRYGEVLTPWPPLRQPSCGKGPLHTPPETSGSVGVPRIRRAESFPAPGADAIDSKSANKRTLPTFNRPPPLLRFRCLPIPCLYVSLDVPLCFTSRPLCFIIDVPQRGVRFIRSHPGRVRSIRG
jgi:hypothetical protein